MNKQNEEKKVTFEDLMNGIKRLKDAEELFRLKRKDVFVDLLKQMGTKKSLIDRVIKEGIPKEIYLGEEIPNGFETLFGDFTKTIYHPLLKDKILFSWVEIDFQQTMDLNPPTIF